MRRDTLSSAVPVDETTPIQRPLIERILPTPIDRTGQTITSQLPPSEVPTRVTDMRGEPLRELPSPAEQAREQEQRIANTTMERRQKYKLNVIRGAERLASQPRRFERIAKPNLAPEERKAKVAEYVIVVDNLYTANNREMAAADAIRASYQELNRVYADDPKVREQAQEYLLAKDLLQAQIDNPE